MVSKVGIAGLGFIGGSIGLALRRNFPDMYILGITRSVKSLPSTDNLNCFDRIVDYQNVEGVRECDIVVISTIVSAIPSAFYTIKPFIGPSTLVTDVGSVKDWVVKEINDLSFIGSHPIAGSEKSGIENSDSEIFKDALCVITPYGNSEEQVKKVSDFWKLLGMRVLVLPPDIHDSIVAETSHFVHLVSFILSSSLYNSDFYKDLFYGVFGKGLIDTTRISNSNSDLWIDIFQKNKQNLLKAFDRFIELSYKVRDEIMMDNWSYVKNVLENANDFVKKLNYK
ncbi:MAG: prephenate dehydrogenase [Brevinematia bacterium]